jgi:hypothetical protein
MPPTLPVQMRILLSHIQHSALASARHRLKVAIEKRQILVNKIQAVVEQLDAQIEAERKILDQSINSERQNLRSQNESISNRSKDKIERGQKLLQEAQAHLESNHVGAPEKVVTLGLAQTFGNASLIAGSLFGPPGYKNEAAPDLFSRLDEQLNRASEILGEIRKTKITAEIASPSGLGCFFLIVSLAASVYMAFVPNMYGARGGFGAFVFWLAIFYCGQALIRASHRWIGLRGRYNDMAYLADRVSADLNQLVAQAQAEFESRGAQLQRDYESRLRDLSSKHERRNAELDRELDDARREYHLLLSGCEKELSVQAVDAQTACEQFRAHTSYVGARWNDSAWQDWKPAQSPAFTASFGSITPNVEDLGAVYPNLDLNFPLPALIPFADGKCLLLKASGEAMAQAARCLQSVMLRLLATIPPGKVNFILIDPVGLGKNVAAMMKLTEYEESLIKSRAWTEPQHIEQRLAELTEHMETVIQKYLRTDYASIEDYNRDAKKVAEPYRALVVMDFPVNFTDTAAKRLISIAQNGPRCGVYTLIMMNTNKPTPHGFTLSELEQHSFVINHNGDSFVWQDPEFETCRLILDQPPDNILSNKIIERIGEQAREAMKVEVPFTELLADAGLGRERWWKSETARNLSVPLGPTGARKQQMLTFGEGLTHHGLIVGRPGSGKTNLMHVIITTLALAYSPHELQVYLVDFKKGVGFKPYADYKLPHAIAIAIESEREFGLSVLQGLDAEMQRRGELFRSVSVEDISEYRRKTGNKLSRLLLVADEFQEFFTHSDTIRTQSEILLDRLTRQGRAFGIHVLLGTQTLQGQNTMPKSVMNQIAVRIALQCSEEDSRIVLSHDNPAARLLSRPGEAIYNAANGLVEGNNLFQVALFTDEDRMLHLKAVAEMVGKNGNQPIIFEGNEPARPETARALNELLGQPTPAVKPKAADAWLGEPTAIRPPVRARLRRQGCSNLLVVSRDEAEGVGMIFSALFSLAAQHAPAHAQFHVVNLATADSEWFELPDQLPELLPHTVKVIGRKCLPDLLKCLSDEMNRRLRESIAEAPTVFLMIIGLQRARDLREDESDHGDDGAPARELFISLLREGPEMGVHTVAWCDSLANALRVIPRRQLREFGLRAATVMSMEDSQAFFDDGAAAKLDKPHRAIFYDDERPGVFDKFRPYGLPGPGWLQQAGARLRDRAQSQ